MMGVDAISLTAKIAHATFQPPITQGVSDSGIGYIPIRVFLTVSFDYLSAFSFPVWELGPLTIIFAHFGVGFATLTNCLTDALTTYI